MNTRSIYYYILNYNPNRKKWNIHLVVFFVFGICIWAGFGFKEASRKQVFHGVIPVDLSTDTIGELSIITYNIAGLPEPLSSAPTSRASSISVIGQKLNRYDIVNVQEDFSYNNELYQTGNSHIYRTEPMKGLPFGDGLNTLSKYPIIFHERIAWEACSGADCLAPKGFSFTRIQLAKDSYVHVYNLHATAQNTAAAVEARRQNLEQLAAFINEYSKDEPLLVMGDFNASYAFSGDRLREFLKHTRLDDCWVLLQNNGKFPSIRYSFMPAEKLSITDSCESIDKIYFRSSPNLKFYPLQYKMDKGIFSTIDGQPLSDHCPVALTLKWELTDLK